MKFRNFIRYIFNIFIFVFIAKIIGLFKDVTLASKFGLSGDLDAYFYIFNISVLLSGVWLSIITVVVLPNLTKENTQNGFSSLVNTLRKFNSYIAIVVALAFFIYLWWFDHFIEMASNKWVYVLFGVSILYFGFQASFYSSVIMAKGNNSNSLLECLPSFFTLFFIVIIYGPISVVIGTTLGFLFYYVSTYIMSRRYIINHGLLTYVDVGEKIKKIGSGVGLLLLGQVIISSTSIVDQLYLSSIDKGSLTLFNYASKILYILTGIGTIVISRAFIPFFSINNEYSKLKVMFFSVLLLVLSSLIVWLISDYSCFFVGLIYGYGKFSNEAIINVSKLLSVILYQAPFFLASLILLSFFSSKNFYYPFLYTGILAFFTKMIFLMVSKGGISVYILAYSTNAMYFVNFLVLVISLYFFKRSEGGYSEKK